QGQGAQDLKPESLIEARLQDQSKGGPGIVPDTIVIGGNYPEDVACRGQIVVVGGARPAGGTPIFAGAFQPVFVLHIFLTEKSQSGKMKLNLARAHGRARARKHWLIID